MKKNDAAKTATETAAEMIDPEKIREAASKTAEIASDFIKKHPLESVGSALVLGVVVGLLINRK